MFTPIKKHIIYKKSDFFDKLIEIYGGYGLKNNKMGNIGVRCKIKKRVTQRAQRK